MRKNLIRFLVFVTLFSGAGLCMAYIGGESSKSSSSEIGRFQFQLISDYTGMIVDTKSMSFWTIFLDHDTTALRGPVNPKRLPDDWNLVDKKYLSSEKSTIGKLELHRYSNTVGKATYFSVLFDSSTGDCWLVFAKCEALKIWGPLSLKDAKSPKN